jgi:hypothetical protein
VAGRIPSIAGKSRGFDQPQPLLDSARLHPVAIVIENALPPCKAEGGIFAASKNGRVFDRNPALVVVAVQRPGLELATRKFSFVHQGMKWMSVVIELFTNGVKSRDESSFRKQRCVDGLDLAHIESSIPS